MKCTRSNLDRFLSALHARLLIVRALEATALGAAAGCAVGAALIPLLYWRGAEAVTPVLGALGLGAIVGSLWGITRRPTRLEAAAEADRQLNLADLLGTALTVRLKARDSDRDDGARPWLGAVLAQADAACAAHTPAEVILHRLHARAWGGIALAAALVLSVAALTSPEPRARAGTPAARPATSRTAPSDAGESNARSRNSVNASRPQGVGPERDREALARATTGGSDAGQEPGSAGSNANTRVGGDSGQGGGNARAREAGVNEKAPAASGGDVTRPVGNGDPAGGGGRATTRPGGGGNTAGTVGAAGSTPAAAAPWESSTWSDDSRRAKEAVDSGRVPDSRRDLVREYFDRR